VRNGYLPLPEILTTVGLIEVDLSVGFGQGSKGAKRW